jgi:hypothetical protein
MTRDDGATTSWCDGTTRGGTPTLPHRTPCALCGSVEKNTDSLVKRMTLCAQVGGGKGRGKKVMIEIAPPVIPWSTCFLLLLRKGFFLIFFFAV